MLDSMTGNISRPMNPDERSGILHPERIARYAAGWIDPDPAVATVVDRYWHVSWSLDDGEELDQRIVDLPAVTLTVEDGDVVAPLVATGVQQRAWRRTIRGRGEIFGIRLRPAGLAVVSDLNPEDLADATIPLTPELDSRAHTLMSGVARRATSLTRAREADQLIAQLLSGRGVTQAGGVANEVMDELRSNARLSPGGVGAVRERWSERTVQRALMATLGHGPKWISRRIRLQEVAFALAFQRDEDLAMIAAQLGYSDQSHLAADFKAVAGVTPSSYRSEIARLMTSGTAPS